MKKCPRCLTPLGDHNAMRVAYVGGTADNATVDSFRLCIPCAMTFGALPEEEQDRWANYFMLAKKEANMPGYVQLKELGIVALMPHMGTNAIKSSPEIDMIEPGTYILTYHVIAGPTPDPEHRVMRVGVKMSNDKRQIEVRVYPLDNKGTSA